MRRSFTPIGSGAAVDPAIGQDTLFQLSQLQHHSLSSVLVLCLTGSPAGGGFVPGARTKSINPRSTFRYEAVRAYFVEGFPSAQAAAQFGYTPGSFRSLVHQFRHNPKRSFFAPTQPEAQQQQRHDAGRQRVLALRKQNLSIYDISQALAHDGHPLSPVAIANILKQEGFARLPRRLDDERPPGTRPTIADVADSRALDLQPRQFRTKLACALFGRCSQSRPPEPRA
jgi:hypothetical protein